MINKEAEAKREKKASKIFFGVAKMAGIAVGLFLLSLIAPLLYEDTSTDGMQALFVKFSLLTFAYVGAMLMTYIFMRPKIFIMNILMQYMYLPAIGLLFAFEAYEIITK